MSAHTCPHGLSASRDGLVPQPRRRVAAWLDWLSRCMTAIETRHHLAGMDDRMLKDIGITRAEAEREASRRPWDHHRLPG